MIIEGVVGPQVLADGAMPRARFERTGGLVSQDAHGRYTEAVHRGNVWTGANLGGTPVTTQAGLSATTPALTLFNPHNSTVNLFLLFCGIAIQASPAAAVEFWLAYNIPTLSGVPTAPTSTTTANVINAKLGAAGSPVGQCYRVATLSAAPLMLHALGGCTGASAIGNAPFLFELGGIVCITPGYAVSIQTSTAAAITGSFTWEELPV